MTAFIGLFLLLPSFKLFFLFLLFVSFYLLFCLDTKKNEKKSSTNTAPLPSASRLAAHMPEWAVPIAIGIGLGSFFASN